jgi:Restriction endonuclease S subunits
MEEWKKFRLGDMIRFNPSEKILKQTLCRKISMDKLNPYNREIYECEYDLYSGGAKFKNGDTIMARITPCLENGKTAYVSCLGDGEIAFGSTEYIVLREKENVSDSKFIYYLAISPAIRQIAIKSMVGSSGRQRVQLGVLENHNIFLPPIQEQKQIANILSSLDDKIALNTDK